MPLKISAMMVIHYSLQLCLSSGLSADVLMRSVWRTKAAHQVSVTITRVKFQENDLQWLKTLKVILQDIYWMFIFYCNLDISKDLQKIKHQENMQKELAANLTISSWLIYYFSVIVLILKWNNNMKWDVKRK